MKFCERFTFNDVLNLAGSFYHHLSLIHLLHFLKKIIRGAGGRENLRNAWNSAREGVWSFSPKIDQVFIISLAVFLKTRFIKVMCIILLHLIRLTAKIIKFHRSEMCDPLVRELFHSRDANCGDKFPFSM